MTPELNYNHHEPTTAKTYRQIVESQGIGDYLRYDEKGHLWLGDLRIVEAVEMYGTPLEIVDTTIVERRCRQWQGLTQKVAEEVGYTGGFEYFYATKANPSEEIVRAAIKAGWQIETSSSQDLNNLYWLIRQGLIDKGNLKVICNGFKLPPQLFGNPSALREIKSKVIFNTNAHRIDYSQEVSYADYISLLRSLGVNIVPIIDAGELNYFCQTVEIPSMEVGLRMKFGEVSADEELERLISRHGMGWKEIRQYAQTIDKVPHLRLTTLHTMVSAAQTIPLDTFVNSLAFAAEKYFELKKDHPTLESLDIGGGIPPFSEDYDHEGLMREFLLRLKNLSMKRKLPEPKIIFELGSLVASEAGMVVFKVIQTKQNKNGETWVIVDGGLMASIPDMLMTEKEFTFLAANNANKAVKLVRIGDISCDSDGQYPTKKMGDKEIWLPDSNPLADWPQLLLVTETGAYQEVLAGIRGAHHCLLLEAGELILERGSDGKIHGKFLPRQTRDDVRKLLGYL